MLLIDQKSPSVTRNVRN